MNIELIAEPLLITERSASEDLEAVDQAGDSQPQAAIVRVTVADRVGVLSNINSSERKKVLRHGAERRPDAASGGQSPAPG